MGQNLDIPWVKTGFQRTVGYIAWRWRTVDDIQIGFMDVHRGRWRCFFYTSYQRNLENWKTWGIIESWLAVHIYMYIYIYNYIYNYNWTRQGPMRFCDLPTLPVKVEMPISTFGKFKSNS
jgi:hypothetical protein